MLYLVLHLFAIYNEYYIIWPLLINNSSHMLTNLSAWNSLVGPSPVFAVVGNLFSMST